MNYLIQALQSVQSYFNNPWVLVIVMASIAIVPAALFVMFYFISRKFTKRPYVKLYGALLCTTFLAMIIYFMAIYFLNKFGVIAVTIKDVATLTMGCLSLMFLSWFIWLVLGGIVIGIVSLIKRITRRTPRIKAEKRMLANGSTQTVVTSENNMGNEFTQTVSKFTSNYLKSFMREGKPINRLQIMLDNKEDYITKLMEICVSRDPNNSVDSRKVAEFYYNYYVKIFSE